MDLWILDVDGVLTDNHSTFDYDGNELIAFNKSDGLAIATLKRYGHEIMCLSGSRVEATAKRMKSWGVPYHISDAKEYHIKQMLNINDKYKTFIICGNDYNDIGMLNLEHDKIKIKSFIPKDAILTDAIVPNSTRLETNGGQGIIREIMENYL